MPDVRLLTDYKGGTAGSIYRLSADELSEARSARAVAKIYDDKIPGAHKLPASKTAAKKAAAQNTDTPAPSES